MIYLYRLYSYRHRDLLYVGISSDVERRVSQHREKSWGHRIVHVEKEPISADRTVALEVEASVIRDERPKFNDAHNGEARQRVRPVREAEMRDRKERAQASVFRKYASITDAAEYLGVSEMTIRRRISDGSLPAERMGPKLLRVKWSDLDALLQPVRGWR